MKDVSDMFHVNLNAVYAQHKVDVWASCFCTHVPQQDLILLRTPYCRHAEKEKNKQTINLTCQVCHPPAVWFHCLPSDHFTLPCSMPVCVSWGFLKCRSANMQVELVSWHNVAQGETVGTPSHCPQRLPLWCPHTHAIAKKLLSSRHTEHIMWEDGLSFYCVEKSRK